VLNPERAMEEAFAYGVTFVVALMLRPVSL
jgi:hypothetical protein